MNKHVRARLQRLDKAEAGYAKQLRRALNVELERLVAIVASGANELTVLANISTRTVAPILEALYLKVIQAEARQEYLYLMGEYKARPVLPIAEWLAAARDFVTKESSKAIVAVTNTTRNLVRQTLKESLSSGVGVQEAAANLRAKVTVFNRQRSITITRTELLGAANKGSIVGARSTGLALDKIWLATSDGRTRASHSAAAGQRVDLNEPFRVGGEFADCPADPGLSAKERIRCRCTQIYRPKAKKGEQLGMQL